MPHRWVPAHEDIRVPVFKNIVYAVKILNKSDRFLLLNMILAQIAWQVFELFIQGVLFLKVLLKILENDCTFSYFVKMLLIFLGIGLLDEVISIASDYRQNIGFKKVYKGLNSMIFEKAASVDISCYEDPAFYDSYQRATELLTNGFFMAFGLDFAGVIAAGISMLLIIGTVASISPEYLLFLSPVLFVLLFEILKSKMLYKRDFQMTSNNRTKQYTRRTVFLKEYAKDIRTSNIFSSIIREFENAVKLNIEIIKKYGFKLFSLSMIASLFGELFPLIGTYGYASYQFMNNSGLDVSGFSVVVSSVNSVRATATNIANSFSEFANVSLYFQNLHDFFDYESKVISGNRMTEDFETLEFKNVSFTYPSSDKSTINNLNFKLEKGKTTALVGINGAGKTTIVKLMLRFYDPTEGEILYNGINIKEYDVNDYRNRFSSVFQDYKTFAISVNENVICHEASDKEKELAKEAMIKSGVWERIKTLPNKADTVLTREFDANGAGLSGGESQKTAVARMFASDFSIAVLDEPSSALDPIAEYNMYENLIEATRDKCAVYISHRLSSAVLSDNIYVIENGHIIEEGTHEFLMNQKGKYARMFELQASNYNSEEGEDNE